MIKVGQIFRPTDSRRDNRRIRVIDRVVGYDTHGKYGSYVIVESRLVGQRTWKPAPAIRLDRLESRAYKLVKGV